MAQGHKTGGRQKGTPNKITKDLREVLKTVLSKEFKDLPKLLASLEPKDRIDAIIKLSHICIPKLHAAEEIIETENPYPGGYFKHIEDLYRKKHPSLEQEAN